MGKIVNGYLWLGKWINLFFGLNILWFGFSLLGGVVLGIFPATTAMYSVYRNKFLYLNESGIAKQFWHSYKKDFWKANGLGYLLVGIIAFLYLDIRVLQLFKTSLLHEFLLITIKLLILIFIIVGLYAFPLFTHFDLSLKNYIKYSVALAIGKPIQTLILIVVLTAGILFHRFIPIIAPIFGISIYSFLIMKVTLLSLSAKEITTNNIEE